MRDLKQTSRRFSHQISVKKSFSSEERQKLTLFQVISKKSAWIWILRTISYKITFKSKYSSLLKSCSSTKEPFFHKKNDFFRDAAIFDPQNIFFFKAVGHFKVYIFTFKMVCRVFRCQ